jgi:tRNA nucleotidyltransferase (CCA-adding enzyme)
MKNRDISLAFKIASAVKNYGGETYFVGGYVRDTILNTENKDIDIEIHGIAPYTLECILDGIGKRLEFGKSFGVYNLCGSSLDIAMPRKETATGRGHKDFKIDVDPFIGTKEACLRRDFTIGALMQNVLTGEITDHFGGLTDLKMGVIRHVSDITFAEDPLRVFRAAQFSARFGFTIAKETAELCKKMDISSLSKERVWEETKKALLKSAKPSLYFENLRAFGKLSPFFSELEQLIGIPQPPKHHAEGDVWSHTMLVLDEAAKLRDRAKNPFGLMVCALAHDLGKIVCTKKIDGIYHAYNHETEGLPLIKRFISRLTSETALERYTLNLARLHMKPNALATQRSSVKATNKMFAEASEPLDLILLAIADNRGRRCEYEPYDTEPFLLERLSVYEEYMSRPHVSGNDLIEAGLIPGKDFSDFLSYAHKLRLAGIEKEEALKQTLAYAVKARKKT